MELDYCVPKGIPHSVFLDWDPVDQDKVIAWTMEKNSKCPDCGTEISAWLDSSGRPLVPEPYVAEANYCRGCATVEDMREELKRQDPDRIGQMKLFLRPTLDDEDPALPRPLRNEEVDD